MAPLDLLRGLLVVGGISLGLAWPLAARLKLDPIEKLVASFALSLIGVWLVGWAIYVFPLPVMCFALIPVTTVVGLFFGRTELKATLSDPDARAVLIAQLLVSGVCVGALDFIVSYSGGGWAGDWFEHWERTRFFLEHGPLDQKFIVIYPLTARPPLENVVTGAFLRLTFVDFAHYQVVSALLASFAFLPVALLARRFAGVGGRVPIAISAVLVLANPLFLQNATFAWTKLPAAAFTLIALYFFLRAHDREAPASAASLFALALAAALLTHFSAGPYAVALGVAWVVIGLKRLTDSSWRQRTLFAALLGAALLVTWFGWALAHFGMGGTFLSNSSVTTLDARQGNQLLKIALNLRDTLVPHFLRSLDTSLIAQQSPWGWWRDVFFQCYQLNVPLVLGSVGWLAVLRETWIAGRSAASGVRRFWLWFIGVCFMLGVAAHGERDHWGLAHICLQALVLLGLAFLAARWAGLPRGWRIALMLGGTVDFCLGIVLHFAVQSYALDAWFGASDHPADVVAISSGPAVMNLRGKVLNHLAFFSDVFTAPRVLVLALLAAMLMLVVARAQRALRAPAP